MKLKEFIKQVENILTERKVEVLPPIHFDLALYPNGEDIFVGDDMSCENLSRVKFTIEVTPHEEEKS